MSDQNPAPKLERVKPEMSDAARAAMAQIAASVGEMGGRQAPQPVFDPEAEGSPQPDGTAVEETAAEAAPPDESTQDADTDLGDGDKFSDIIERYNRLKSKVGKDGQKHGEERKAWQSREQELMEEIQRLRASSSGDTQNVRQEQQRDPAEPLSIQEMEAVFQQISPEGYEYLKDDPDQLRAVKPVFDVMTAMFREINAQNQQAQALVAQVQRERQLASIGLSPEDYEVLTSDPRGRGLANLNVEDLAGVLDLVSSLRGNSAPPSRTQAPSQQPSRVDPRTMVESGSPGSRSTGGGAPNLGEILRTKGASAARQAAAPMFEQIGREWGLK